MAALAGTAIAAGGAMLAAARGQVQDRPGQIGQSKVFVENRGTLEAVPVAIQEVVTPSPIGVQVVGTPTVSVAPATIVQARLIRQSWEYRTISIGPTQDAASALTAAGLDGWEMTGVQLPDRSGATVVLKRPRN
jgi:hypothetical protein